VARFQAVVKGTGPLSRLPYGFRAGPVGDLAGRDSQVIGRAKPAGPQFVIGSPRRREQLLRFRVLGEFSGQDQGGLAAQGRKKPRAGFDQLQAVLNFFTVNDPVVRGVQQRGQALEDVAMPEKTALKALAVRSKQVDSRLVRPVHAFPSCRLAAWTSGRIVSLRVKSVARS